VQISHLINAEETVSINKAGVQLERDNISGIIEPTFSENISLQEKI